MKTLKEKIAVMQAALDGKDIELKGDRETEWRHVTGAVDVVFSWGSFDFRVKPEPLGMEKEIKELKEKLERVYEAGCWGISHVAMANYASRELEAANKIEDAMYGEEI